MFNYRNVQNRDKVVVVSQTGITHLCGKPNVCMESDKSTYISSVVWMLHLQRQAYHGAVKGRKVLQPIDALAQIPFKPHQNTDFPEQPCFYLLPFSKRVSEQQALSVHSFFYTICTCCLRGAPLDKPCFCPRYAEFILSQCPHGVKKILAFFFFPPFFPLGDKYIFLSACLLHPGPLHSKWSQSENTQWCWNI